jgi:hypothetical protein
VWLPVLSSQHLYTNDCFKPQPGVLVPVIRGMRVALWTRLFSTWHEKVWRAAWLQANSFETRAEGPGRSEDARLTSTANGGGSTGNKMHVTNCTRCRIMFLTHSKRVECKRCVQVYCEKCCRDSRMIPAISSWFPTRVCYDCCLEIDSEEKPSSNKLNDSYTKVVGALTGLRLTPVSSARRGNYSKPHEVSAELTACYISVQV